MDKNLFNSPIVQVREREVDEVIVDRESLVVKPIKINPKQEGGGAYHLSCSFTLYISVIKHSTDLIIYLEYFLHKILFQFRT